MDKSWTVNVYFNVKEQERVTCGDNAILFMGLAMQRLIPIKTPPKWTPNQAHSHISARFSSLEDNFVVTEEILFTRTVLKMREFRIFCRTLMADLLRYLKGIF